MLKAPFPWFGGKSRVAAQVWERFGNVCQYTEPFFGSGAVLLARPGGPGKNETVNDLDCYLANFFRAVSADPELVAEFADHPVNECDLHARHTWLMAQTGFREHMRADPHYFDAKIAGWWVWGISQWIGSGWCVHPEWTGRYDAGKPRGLHAERWRKRPILRRGGAGVHRISQQIPDISGDSGACGRGIHAAYVAADIYDYFEALCQRLRRVRVCCGDWMRILGESATIKIGVTGIFLDPPYASQRDSVYAQESFFLAHEVREWAIHMADDPMRRIALCSYGEHDEHMPHSWTCLEWKTNGGYANSGKGAGRENASREKIWFSPHCLPVNKEGVA